MLNFISNVFLQFTHITVILPFIVFGMIFHDRKRYSHAACLLFFVMIWNTLLKHSFKIPLMPHLGAGYCYPSGHFHIAIVFYGYLFYKTRNEFVKIALTIILCGCGWSLIHNNYHDLTDVIGALLFGIAEVIIYYLLLATIGVKRAAIFVLLFSVVIMFTLTFVHKIEYHVWLAFYGLLGFICSLSFGKEYLSHGNFQKILACILSFIFIGAIMYVFQYVKFAQFYLSELRFVLLPFAIVGSVNIVDIFQKKTCK